LRTLFKDASETDVAACEMEVPFDLEADLLTEIPSKDQTWVAFALLKWSAGAHALN